MRMVSGRAPEWTCRAVGRVVVPRSWSQGWVAVHPSDGTIHHHNVQVEDIPGGATQEDNNPLFITICQPPPQSTPGSEAQEWHGRPGRTSEHQMRQYNVGDLKG